MSKELEGLRETLLANLPNEGEKPKPEPQPGTAGVGAPTPAPPEVPTASSLELEAAIQEARETVLGTARPAIESPSPETRTESEVTVGETAKKTTEEAPKGPTDEMDDLQKVLEEVESSARETLQRHAPAPKPKRKRGATNGSSSQ